MRPRDFLGTSFCLCVGVLVGVRVGVLAWVCLRGCACACGCACGLCVNMFIYVSAYTLNIWYITYLMHVDGLGQICM